MIELGQITDSLLSAVDEVNEGLPADKKVPRNENAVLFGSKAEVDSLTLINLVIVVERKIEQDFGKSITLADERALMEEKSPFRTLGTMADYVAKLLKEQGD
jgi:D-alanine--poly(phosphoribitol) ligase subunit 2